MIDAAGPWGTGPFVLTSGTSTLAKRAPEVIMEPNLSQALHLLNGATTHDFDRVDRRREQREHAFYAFAEADLANGEVRVEATASAGDANAFVGLHALTIAFFDLHVHAQRVARIERGDGLALSDAGDFFFFKRIDQVHRRTRGRGLGAPSSRKTGKRGV